MPISSQQIFLILVFFIYGLAFFSMGLAMTFETRRSPFLAEGRVLRPLAIFGYSHGIHEWLEMGLLAWGSLGLHSNPGLDWLRLILLAFSFTSLIFFGLRLLQPQSGVLARDISVVLALLVLFTILVLWIGAAYRTQGQNLIWLADALSRYTLAIPGAALAALVLYRRVAQAQRDGRSALANSLRFTAAGFALYAVTQAFVTPLDLFPARYLNTAIFIQYAGVPIQVVRAGLAVLITTSLIRSSQVVEDERQQQFINIQKGRLDALDQVRQELIEREHMRHDLLQHIVVAQEDERGRIARELHDETAQVLTAFSLNLAALQKMLSGDNKSAELLDRLQQLSRQMSQGIYRMVRDLRPSQLDDLGLVAALQYLAEEEQRQAGLQIDLEISGTRRKLDPLAETVLFRVAQEALNNVARHAQVSRASVQLQYEPERVFLRVCDCGVGFDLQEEPRPPHGWGLAGMRERAESIDADFSVTSSPGEGTAVEIVLPGAVKESRLRR